MKKFAILLAAGSAVALMSAPASAQPWVSINERQARLDERIDVGVRNGDLTRSEAVRLRAQFNDLARLEANYRRNGLTSRERADLDSRFDNLSAQIRYERRDGNDRGWTNINARQREIDARIDRGLRDRSLSRTEAQRLRYEFQQIAALEARYRDNGLSQRERRDLDMRFDRLSARVEAERRDRDNRYG